MENMEIIIYPKQLYYIAQSPMNIRLTYKKVCISTNHELQKIQNRQSYPLKNGMASINSQIKFKLSKQFQLKNTKIVIIIIGIKGRQVLCLGDINIDLVSLRQKQHQKKQFYKAKLDKSKDPNAHLIFDVKFIQKSVDLNEIKRNKKQKIPQLGILKTQCYYKEELYISRRQKQDKPTAYQISRQNFKNVQIKRNYSKSQNKQKNQKKETNKSTQKGQSKESSKQNSNRGSYKKRFQYQVNRLQKSRTNSSNSKSFSNHHKIYQKDKSPSPRVKTPQPIKIEALRLLQSNRKAENQKTPTISHYYNTQSQQQNSNIKQNFKNQSFPQNNQDFNQPDTFRIDRNAYKNQNNRRQDLYDSNKSSISQSKITNLNGSKYTMIAQKLQKIQQHIHKQRESYAKNSQVGQIKQNQNINQHNKMAKYEQKISKSKVSKVSGNQIQQKQSYQISKGYKPSVSDNLLQKSVDQRMYYTQNSQSPYYSKKQNKSEYIYSPNSLNQSTCPRNEQPPSPIDLNQRKRQITTRSDGIKEFTINSRKNQHSQQQLNGTFNKVSCQNNNQFKQITKNSSNEIIQATMPNKQINQRGFSNQNRKNNSSRQRSPNLQPKLEKKSSIGRNYLQTQLKMYQLQVQERDMKYQRLQKKYIKKQQQITKIQKQNQEYKHRITNLLNQIIIQKQKNIQLQKRILQFESNIELIHNQKKQTTQLRQNDIKVEKTSILHNQLQKQFLSAESQTFKNEQQPRQKQLQSMLTKLNNQRLKDKQILASLNQRIVQFQQQNKQLKQTYIKIFQQNKKNLQKVQSLKVQLNKLDLEKKQARNKIIQKKNQKQSQVQTQKQIQYNPPSINVWNQSNQLNINGKKIQNNEPILKDERLLKDEIILKDLQIYIQKVQNLQNALTQLQRDLQKKQKIIQKLNSVNQSHIQKIYNQKLMHQENQKKIRQNDQFLQNLILKNQQNQQYIKELNEIIKSKNRQISLKQNQINIKGKQINTKQKDNQLLKKMLKQLQSKSYNQDTKTHANKQPKSQQQKMQRQVSQIQPQKFNMNKQGQKNLNNNKSIQNLPSNQIISKSVQLKNPPVQKSKQDYYQNYMTQKTKSNNLEAQLRFAQNNIRNLMIQIDNLKLQRKNLQQQLDRITLNNSKQTSKKGTTAKTSNFQNNSVNQPNRLQNQVLRQQIKSLRSQVKDLDALLDLAIKRANNPQIYNYQNASQQPIRQNNQMSQKYQMLVKRLEAYQQQIRSKKNKMAQIINAIWKGGNANLIDQIDKIMSQQQ